jgi:SAM-dependent methyltransferase
MSLAVFAQEIVRGTLRDPLQHLRRRTVRHCPICDYKGYFLSAGRRQEARCPNCASKERDRIFGLHLKKRGFDPAGKKILHFSAERPFFHRWRKLEGYVAGDIKKSRVANAVVDITRIQFPDNTFDVLICHHVLEHVPDDAKAIAECFRVLKPGGEAYFSVPQANAHDTWEPPPGMPKAEVEEICGWDHVRMYGLDFPERLARAGFKAQQLKVTPEEDATHRLQSRGIDNVYVAAKPA